VWYFVIEPEECAWFNNKIKHGAINIGDVDRISLVFDVPHSTNNPHHEIERTQGF